MNFAMRLLSVSSLAAVLFSSASLNGQSTNQMVTNSGDRGDPTVIWVPELKMYLGARTDGPLNGSNGITLYGSNRLEDLFTVPTYTISIPIPKAGAGAEAPGLLEWQSSADNNPHLYIGYKDQNNNHQVVVDNSVTDPFCQTTSNCWSPMSLIANPDKTTFTTNPYAFVGRDWSYFVHGGTLWAFFEYGPGSTPGGVWVQELIDPMNVNYNQPAVQISQAIPPDGSGNNLQNARIWEFRHNAGDGTNEAPVAFSHTDSQGKLLTFVTYSANGYSFGDYDMGLLTFTGAASDRLDNKANWFKSQNPIFQALNYSTTVGDQEWVCNVGSNSVVQSPDGKEWWDVYNGKFNCRTVANPNYTGSNPGPFNQPTQLATPNGRTIRVQKIDWDPGAQTESNPTGGSPIFGQPWIDGELHNQPSGEADVPSYAFLTPASGNSSQTFDDAYGRVDPATGQQLPFDGLFSRIFYDEAWTTTTGNPGARGNGGNVTGSLTSSTTNGSDFVVAFTGSRIALYGPTGTYTDGAGKTAAQGQIAIYVDGKMANPTAKDLSQPLQGNLWFDSNTDLAPGALNSGSHTLTVVVNGKAPVQLDNVTVSNSIGGGAASCAEFDMVKASFGKSKGQPGYNPAADLNNDGVVNIEDLSTVARNVPTGTTCH